jgi:hypothetical protein
MLAAKGEPELPASEWLAGEREADEDIAAGRGPSMSRLRPCLPILMRSARGTTDADVRPHGAGEGQVLSAAISPRSSPS